MCRSGGEFLMAIELLCLRGRIDVNWWLYVGIEDTIQNRSERLNQLRRGINAYPPFMVKHLSKPEVPLGGKEKIKRGWGGYADVEKLIPNISYGQTNGKSQ